MSSSTLDMLRAYPVSLIVLDQWGEPHDPSSYEASAGADALAKLPAVRVETSIDGFQFAQVSDPVVRLSSLKGSRGSRRSYILNLPDPVPARFVRLTYAASGPEFKPRILISERTSRWTDNDPVVDVFLPDVGTRERKYKAVVIGDSNSVMRYGWVRGLDQGAVKVIGNMSLGASHLTLVADRLAEATALKPDIVLVNSVVNEYFPPRSANYDVTVAEDVIRYVQGWCAEKSVVPIFVIWPHLHHENPVPGDTHPRDYYAALCEGFGMPYIDAWKIAEKLAAGWERSFPSLFLNDPHLLGHPAQVIGAAISDLVTRFLDGLDCGSWGCVDKEAGVHRFQSLSIPGNAAALKSGVTQRMVETNLLAKTMVTLRTGQWVDVKVPDGWDVVGYLINYRASSGSISLQGRNEVRRRVDFHLYQGHGAAPYVCVRSLESPVTPEDGSVRVSCVDPSASDEPDSLAYPASDPSFEGERQIEVGQLILRSRTNDMAPLKLATEALNLTHILDLRFALQNPNL